MFKYRASADIRLSVTLCKGVCLIENDKRVRIICGHYGSGKTEFAVNYAIRLAKEGGKPVLADIDIINPYFRSRERTEELENLGVEVVASATSATALDVPAISAGIHSVFDDTSRDAVVDVGGNEAGVKVLNRFADHFRNSEEYELFFIINANRPETIECSQILEFIRSFENAC
ncbi:MAG TPA: hypothetical protein DCO79_13620, partial [Spirochaeta sp.]|nr:hypothetical protein [Spirochaeta sp.]